MKKMLFTFLLLTIFARSPSQSVTTDNGAGGEYGAPVVKISTIRNTTGIFLGGRGGWILNHSFALGVGGYFLTTDVNARSVDTSGQGQLTMSYGGVDLEFTPASNHFLHLTFQTLIGGGAIAYQQEAYVNPRQHHNGFFILEPGMSLEFNLTEGFRLNLEGSYRIVAWLRSDLATNADLSGSTATLALKIGVF